MEYICKKEVTFFFTKGKKYKVNKCKKNEFEYITVDNEGNEHVVAYYSLKEDEWFLEHFEGVKL